MSQRIKYQADQAGVYETCAKVRRQSTARGNKCLSERERETKSELSLLAIDRLAVILLASCYSDWNITLWISLLEYPPHDTLVRSALQPASPIDQPTHTKGGERCTIGAL